MILSCLVGDATSSLGNIDATSQNVLNVSDSCLFYNKSQLYYYCGSQDHTQLNDLPITANDLNTIRISKNLCGNYENHQGTYVALYIMLYYSLEDESLANFTNKQCFPKLKPFTS